MSDQVQGAKPPPRKRVFLWLLGVYAAVVLACILLTVIPLMLFGRGTVQAARDQQATAAARGQPGGFGVPRADDDNGTVPPELVTFTPVPTIDTRPTDPASGVAPITLPGSAAQQPAATVPPLPASTPTQAEAVPGGDPSTIGQGSNPDMFANSGTAIPTERIEGVTPGAKVYEVTAQTPKSTLRVINAWQTSAGMVLTVNYDAIDSRKVGISAPGDPDAFYIQSGSKRYPLTSAANIAIGSTSQEVAVGGSLIFTLTFAPLDDPTQPFDLIEGEHTASASASYWDVEGVQLKPR